MRFLKLAVALLLVVFTAPAVAAPAAASGAAAAIPALFISDIHYDPFRDPALAPRLNAAPASEWPAILATPSSPNLSADSAALQKVCPVRGDDPDQKLWQSTLAALRAQAANSRFILLSGDILPHNFECRYQFLFPRSTHADYLNFTLNTIRYAISSLRAALPGIPLYAALGNNDTACTGNSLDPGNDFLTLTARVIAESFPTADRRSVMHDIAAGGYYSVLMAPPMRRTRLLVVDNLFSLTEFSTCAKQKDYSEEAVQARWLNRQLALARHRRERVWVLGHIPPGVSLYTTFLHNLQICDGQPPAMSQHTEGIARALADNIGTVRLAIFAHTHSDAFSLLTPTLGDPGPAPPAATPGVPVKVIASVSAVNGNNPSFTLASIDPATSDLRDYTIIQSSNLTGIDASWTPLSHYAADYGEPDFSARPLKDLIARFRADPKAEAPASQAYIRSHYSSELTTSADRAAGWPISVCQMDHDTGASFAACACASGAMPPGRPRITGISHVAYFVSDMPRSLQFWHDLLGFDLSYNRVRPNSTETTVAFLKVNDHQYVELLADPPAGSKSFMSHLCFITDDIERMRTYLASLGVTVPGHTSRTRTGDLVFQISDPDGTQIEFSQPQAASVEAQGAGKFLPATRISQSIYHVGFLVGNTRRALDFYNRILGFHETWRGASSPVQLSWINMQVPDGTDYVEFMLYSTLPGTYGSANHVALQVPDVAAAKSAIESRPVFGGYAKSLSIHTGVNGKRQLNLFDPDGTRVELMEPATADGKPVPPSSAPPPPPAHAGLVGNGRSPIPAQAAVDTHNRVNSVPQPAVTAIFRNRASNTQTGDTD